MISSDFTRAMKDLQWNYSDSKLNIVFDTVHKLDLNYENLLRLGIEFNTKPAPKKLLKAIFNLVDEASKEVWTPFEVINLDADDDYFVDALEKSFMYGFIVPMLFICIDNLEKYLKMLENIGSERVYEICWCWLCSQGYEHNLPTPAIRNPEIWKYCGIETG